LRDITVLYDRSALFFRIDLLLSCSAEMKKRLSVSQDSAFGGDFEASVSTDPM